MLQILRALRPDGSSFVAYTLIQSLSDSAQLRFSSSKAFGYISDAGKEQPFAGINITAPLYWLA